MGKKQDEGYKKLHITRARWCTEFFLVSPEQRLETSTSAKLDNYEQLDFNQFYDIKTSPEKSFESCRVYYLSDSEDGFFEAAGLEIKLKSGFLMKVNKKVTSQKNAEKAEKERQDKLQDLYQTRKELDTQINNLER